MSYSKNKKKQRAVATDGNRILLLEIFGALSLLISLFIWISLCSYGENSFADGFFTGRIGFAVALQLSVFFGYASFFIPVLISLALFCTVFHSLWRHIMLNLLFFLSLLLFFQLIDTDPLAWGDPGGWFGMKLLTDVFRPYLGLPGIILFLVLVFLVYITLTLRTPLIFRTVRKAPLLGALIARTAKALGNSIVLTGRAISAEREKTASESDDSGRDESFDNGASDEADVSPLPPDLVQDTDDHEEVPQEKGVSRESSSAAAERGDDIVVKTSGEMKTSKKKKKRPRWPWKSPPLSLLTREEKRKNSTEREKNIEKTAMLIERKLMQHNIAVDVKEATIGPVVTMYELSLGEGVKVSQVNSMEQDIAVVVGGKRIRVVPRLPGKPYIGIEVPNDIRLTIRMRAILESDEFTKHADDGLPLVLGKTVNGEAVVADLAAMPHLLVAGTTGSGKSVGLNAFICSMLFTYSPRDVQFLMIDPKGNEFNIYEDIPHLLMPVVVDSKKAALAVKWAVDEMEERFRILSENYVRDIKSYNKKVAETNKNLKNRDQHLSRMPYIVIVIDEFADLMMVAGKDVEIAVTRIAQKARAVGIHLIIATQRPTRDVITGLIKGNLPVRMAFRVASSIDSRTILDKNGAEKLLGKGDMLFIPPGSSEPQRVHGAFIAGDEAKAVVEHIRKNTDAAVRDSILTAAATSPEEFVENGASGGEADVHTSDDAEDEPLWDEVIAYIRRTRKCSASRLQRKFKIGYNRAARIVEDLEEKGYVGPQDGSKPREVLLSKSDE